MYQRTPSNFETQLKTHTRAVGNFIYHMEKTWHPYGLTRRNRNTRNNRNKRDARDLTDA